jgi:hypothetical protein
VGIQWCIQASSRHRAIHRAIDAPGLSRRGLGDLSAALNCGANILRGGLEILLNPVRAGGKNRGDDERLSGITAAFSRCEIHRRDAEWNGSDRGEGMENEEGARMIAPLPHTDRFGVLPWREVISMVVG